MAQTFNTIAATDTLSASRQTILDRDAAVQSNFSGTAFPTTNIVVGQFCFRTDQNILYMLKDTTPTWIQVTSIAAATAIVPNANLLDGYDTSTGTTASTIPVRNASGQLPGDITGNAATASAWATARTLSFTGDVTGSGSVSGSANVATAMTLANSGATAGSYTAANITVDAKGRVTAASSNSSLVSSFNTRTGAVTLTSADVTGALGYTPVATTGATFTGNVVASGSAQFRSTTTTDNARNTGYKDANGGDIGELNRSTEYFDDRIANCRGYMPNGNCAGNTSYNPPNGNWWTWGVASVPTTNCTNNGQYDGAGGNTSTLQAVSVNFIYDGYYEAANEIGGSEQRRNYNNCNCGNCGGYSPAGFNCRTNCNCNCDCNCACGDG